MLWFFSWYLSLGANYGAVLFKSRNITKSSNVQINVQKWTGRRWPLMVHEKFTVTTFSLEKIVVSITFKNCIFSCFKTSSDNGDLDIYWKVAALLLFDNTGDISLIYSFLLFISLIYSFSSREKWPENELNDWLHPV